MGVCYISSHIHIFIFTSTQIILKSSHLHLHIYTDHPQIFTSSSSHLHRSSSNLHIFASSHPHICTSAHLRTSSHIFTHLLSLSLSLSLALLPSVTVSLLLFLFSLWQRRRGAMRFNRQKLKVFLRLWLVRRQPFRTK